MTDRDSDILSLIDDECCNKDVILTVTDDSNGTIEVFNNNTCYIEGEIEVQIPQDFILVSKNRVIFPDPMEQNSCLLYGGIYCFIRKSDISLNRL